MLASGLMDNALAPTVPVVAQVSNADNGQMGSAHTPTVSVIAQVSGTDKWPN